MSSTRKLKRALVVISPDLVDPGSPRESALISRALELAKASGCELELFHACYDPSLEQGMFGSDPAVLDEKQRVTNREAALLAELVVRLKSEGVTVHHDVRWDHPRTDAILRKIEDSQPDLVLKESREHDFVMGLTRNTDWDLIRKSPANVWFVSGSTAPVSTVTTAIGISTRNDEPFSAVDYDVFRTAAGMAKGFNAKHYPVHAFQAPSGMAMYAAYAPDMVAAVSAPAQSGRLARDRQQVAAAHGRSIRAFADSLGIAADEIRVEEGHRAEVLPRVARELESNLIVMGARSLSRWARVVRPVTAEPVLAETPCDVLFVKDDAEARIPVASEPPLRGTPPIDLERALTDPQAFFGSPLSVASHEQISPALRRRILQIWEQYVRAQMTAEGEGGTVGTTSVDVMDEIHAAKARLLCDEPPEAAPQRSLAAVR
ncbi:MAG TPA: universal stress protein [Woeseiaceae bacterium]|nr:universal stress protein [Woeseiaceae bacterium]